MPWNQADAAARIDSAIEQHTRLEVSDLVREIDVRELNLSLEQAFRVDGVHAYVELLEAGALLGTGSATNHKRFVRLLHLLNRVVSRDVLGESGAVLIDQQNHRLHLLHHKPYPRAADSPSEARARARERVGVRLATVDAIERLLKSTPEFANDAPTLDLCVGVESGVTLVVKNGTRGQRQALFIGPAANVAAKQITPGRRGVHLGPAAREIFSELALRERSTASLRPCARGCARWSSRTSPSTTKHVPADPTPIGCSATPAPSKSSRRSGRSSLGHAPRTGTAATRAALFAAKRWTDAEFAEATSALGRLAQQRHDVHEYVLARGRRDNATADHGLPAAKRDSAAV